MIDDGGGEGPVVVCTLCKGRGFVPAPDDSPEKWIICPKCKAGFILFGTPADDPRKQMVVTNIIELINDRFGGWLHEAWHYYDPNRTGKLGPDEIFAVFTDAQIGIVPETATETDWSRNKMVADTIKAIDLDGDGSVSWDELDSAIADKRNAMTDDPRKQIVIDRIKILVKERFGGSLQSAFIHYDASGDGKLGPVEVWLLFTEAGVGNFMSRGTWVGDAIRAIDIDGDGLISWDDLNTTIKRNS